MVDEEYSEKFKRIMEVDCERLKRLREILRKLGIIDELARASE